MRRLKTTPLSALACALGVAGCDQGQPAPPPEVGVVTLKAQPATLLTELPRIN